MTVLSTYHCFRNLLVTLMVVVCVVSPVAGQDAPADVLPVAMDTLRVTGPGPFLLRPFVVEESLRMWMDNRLLSGTDVVLNASAGLFTIPAVAPDSAVVIVASYAYVPLSSISQRTLWARRETGYDSGVNRTRNPGTRTLERSGSVTRGVITGSGRDAAIESALRFQVNGEIAPGLRVVAALTDEDTPILPQGTTRRLDQFDRVFIRLETDRGHLELGDVDLDHQGGIFGGVRRSLQGAVLQAENIRSAGATSRGLFRSQGIVPLDGVQGPYRLEGTRGERFLLLVPGSERVYLDGMLLTRGLSNDYTIDYTTAEITFTSRHIMGPERRVRVEFEYTTNQFTRTFLLADGRAAFGRDRSFASLAVTAIRESDGNAFTEELAFTAADSAAVAAAGDSTPFRPGAELVIYDAEALFTQYFSTTAPDGSTVYRPVDRTPLPGESVFRVTFTRVGSGNGSYERTGSQGNGIVFSFVGAGAGSYSPLVPLRAPARQELVDMRLELRPVPGLKVNAEWSASRLDRNVLSTLDAVDNEGRAWAIGLRSDRRMLAKDAIWVEISGQHTSRSAHYSAFERVRDVEFGRKWNMDLRAEGDVTGSILPGASEALTDASVTVGAFDSTRVELGASRLELGPLFSGRSGNVLLESAEVGFAELSAYSEWTQTRDGLVSDADPSNGTWGRHRIRIGSHSARRSRMFMSLEKNRLRTNAERTGVSREPDATVVGVGLATSVGRLGVDSRLERRSETRWRQGAVPLDALVWTGQTTLRADTDRGFIRVDAGMRRTRLDSGTQDDALLLGIQSDLRMTRRLNLRTFYDARSERSAALQEIYIRTGPERGQFVWDDFNGDGVIQLDEFVPETNPTEGTYVRTLLPGDSLEAVTNVSARLQLDVDPDRTAGWLGAALSTVIEVRETSRSGDRAAIYLLRPSALRTPGETVQGRVRFEQSARLLPTVRRADLDLSVQTVRSLSGLSAGDELGRSDMAEISGRLLPLRGPEWSMRLGRERNTSTSASFSSRSYDIRSWRARPSVKLKPSERATIVLAPELALKRETSTNAAARVVILPAETTWVVRERLRSTVRLEHARVQLDERRVGRAAFELTDGRGEGASWLWRMGLQAEFSDRLSARFSYDGRAPAGGRTIHTGRVQFTALF